jgi:exodeoxyribonuclease VII large subunit
LNDPAKKDKTGFAQISKDKKLISLESLKEGDIFSVQTPKVEITAEVKKRRELT